MTIRETIKAKAARAERRATAYHEAGHAVAGYWKRIGLSRVTIRPEDDTLGHCSHANLLKGRDIEWDTSDANLARTERQVQAILAGHAAERRYRLARGMGRPQGSADDYHAAIGLLNYFNGNQRPLEAHLSYMEVCSKEFLRSPIRWRQIRAVAKALLCHETLNRKALEEIINPGSAALRASLRANLRKASTLNRKAIQEAPRQALQAKRARQPP